MNRIVSFVAEFSLVEGVTAAVSLLALLVSGIAVLYARRSAAAAEKSADAAMRQAETAERVEQHARTQSRSERMRARVKYRNAANAIVTNLTRLQGSLAESPRDFYVSGFMLTAEALTELRLLSVEAGVTLHVELLRPIIDAPPSLLSESPRFPLSERQIHIDRLEAVSQAIRQSIQEAEQADPQI